jgi:hypothetical protein
MTLITISIYFTTSWTSIIVLLACAAFRTPCHLKISQKFHLFTFCFDFFTVYKEQFVPIFVSCKIVYVNLKMWTVELLSYYILNNPPMLVFKLMIKNKWTSGVYKQTDTYEGFVPVRQTIMAASNCSRAYLLHEWRDLSITYYKCWLPWDLLPNYKQGLWFKCHTKRSMEFACPQQNFYMHWEILI